MKLTHLLPLAIFVLLVAGLAKAQQGSEPGGGSNVLGTVTQGNTTIIFTAANSSDLDLERLRTWQQFANANPKVASTLAYKPKLISEPGYLSNHHELNEFFQAHPDVRDAMVENPGNFVAIPPRPGE
jgi:hypothetical protein